MAQIPYGFGRLCFLAEHREESRPPEEARLCDRLYVQARRKWLGLTLERQSRGLTDYTACLPTSRILANGANRAGFIERLEPAGCVGQKGNALCTD